MLVLYKNARKGYNIDRPGAYNCACAIPTKWRPRHPESPVELSVFGEFICSKELGYRVDWCVNHSLQSNQFVGRRVEEEEEEKEKHGEKNRGLTDFHI